MGGGVQLNPHHFDSKVQLVYGNYSKIFVLLFSSPEPKTKGELL